jgi:hypothetical protein
MSRTPFSSSRESTSGDREMVVVTEPDLTIGERGKQSFIDGQQDSQSGSRWQDSREITDDGDEVGSSTSMESQPGDSVQDKSYAVPTPHTVSLALPPTGETSGEEAHRSMVSTPAAETLQDELRVIREYIVQPTPKKKRAFSHRTKTGCITCRHRKKKCDEQKPSCMQGPSAR